jgi:hypothetical protein
MSPSDKLKIGRTNAIKLFKLPLEMEVEENDKPYFKGEARDPWTTGKFESCSRLGEYEGTIFRLRHYATCRSL